MRLRPSRLGSSGSRLLQSPVDPLPVGAVPEDLLAADTLPEAVVTGPAPGRHPLACPFSRQLGQLATTGHAAGLLQRQLQFAEDVGQLIVDGLATGHEQS